MAGINRQRALSARILQAHPHQTRRPLLSTTQPLHQTQQIPRYFLLLCECLTAIHIAVEDLRVRNDRPLIEQCEGCGAVVAVKLQPPERTSKCSLRLIIAPGFSMELRNNAAYSPLPDLIFAPGVAISNLLLAREASLKGE